MRREEAGDRAGRAPLIRIAARQELEQPVRVVAGGPQDAHAIAIGRSSLRENFIVVLPPATTAPRLTAAPVLIAGQRAEKCRSAAGPQVPRDLRRGVAGGHVSDLVGKDAGDLRLVIRTSRMPRLIHIGPLGSANAFNSRASAVLKL